MNGAFLCRLDDIPDGDSEGFIAEVNGRRQAVLAVRHDETVHVYVNSCPHIGAPLDFTPGRFLNVEKTHILCTNHMALFRFADGVCVSGPCLGDSLEPVSTRLVDGAVYVAGEDPATP